MEATISDEGGPTKTKVCPRCGEELFADMNVCYGCLYDFTHVHAEDMGELFGLDEPDDLDLPWDAGMPPMDLELSADETMPLCSELSLACRATVPSLWIRGGDMDVTIPLGEGVSVGRMPTNDVVLHSGSVSRRHVVFEPDGEGATVADQGATNPAMLHGRPVAGPTSLSQGETVCVCGTMFTLVGCK